MTDDRFRTGGAFDAMPSKDSSVASRLIGRTLSGYEICDLAGQGGMGYVFGAKRAEGDFDRRAAIKIVPATMASPEVARRFRTEVQILAKLNHASIAQLYDVGETDEGWPYFIMEYVDGHPIDDYCKSKGIGVDGRVAMLSEVVRAVRFAHARLVVHRDLKPSNVLVTGDGKPKLLDFGIAKLLEPGTDQHTIAHRPMTPKYASPEQLLGSDITTGSDIYQLGVLFISVFGEELPFTGTTLKDAIKRAAAGEDASISDSVKKRLPTDLTAIITRCLHSDPEDRYPDVNALLTDLIRYQDGYPVHAREGSVLYRVRKLIRRNTPATVFAVLAAVIAIGGGAYYAVNMTKARDLAENRARTSSQVLQAMSSMIAETYSELIETRSNRSSALENNPQLQNEPLRLALERTDRLIESVVTDDLEIRGQLLLVQGMTNRELNRLDTARTQLDESLGIAQSTNNAASEVAVLHELMKLELFESKNSAARQHLDVALEIFAGNVVPDKLRADVFVTGTHIETDLGHSELALEFAQMAIDILERQPGPPSITLPRAYVELGSIYGRLEQRELLREWMEKAIQLYIELEGPSYRGLATAYSGLAFSYALNGEYELALDYFRRELEVSMANFGEQHVRTSLGLINSAIALRRMGRYEEAIDNMLRAEDILLNVSSDDTQRFSTLYTNLGNVYKDVSDFQKALETYEKGLVRIEDHESNPRDLAYLLNNSGDLLNKMGRTAEGQERLRRALTEKTRIFGADNISTARTILLLVEAQVQTGMFTDADKLLADAETIYKETYGLDHTKMSFLELVKGKHARAHGDLDVARQLIENCFGRRLEEYHENHSDVLTVALELARTELVAGDAERAQYWLDKTVEGTAELASHTIEYIESRLVKAEILSAQGKGREAQELKNELADVLLTRFPDRSDWKDRMSGI